MRNKIVSLFLILMLLLSFVSCSSVSEDSFDGITIVAACFPEYDWVRNIVGDDPDVRVSLLVDNGSDMHNYQPTASDILMISSCDIMVYVGGESSEWLLDAVNNSGNNDMISINLLDFLEGRLILEEDEEEEEYDEHVWLSLQNAVLCCDEITDALCSVNPSKASLYRENSSAYISELRQLDSSYSAVVSSASSDVLVFADRFPFTYMASDYDLTCFSAFPGCSAETGASFEMITDLASAVSSNSVPYVLVIDGGRDDIAGVVCDTAGNGAGILVMDSMQSVNMNEINDGYTYIDAMTSNLNVLEMALNGTN